MSLLDAPAIRAATMAEVSTLLRSLELPPGTALAATGSFARREMTPYSDIDLLLIHPDGTQPPQADGVWYPIWDAKKRLDYAVRTHSGGYSYCALESVWFRSRHDPS